MTSEELIGVAKSHLIQNYKQQPVVLSRGKGVELWDVGGRRFLDMTSGIAVCALGHAHPGLTAAIAEQAGKLLHASNLYFIEAQIVLADLLAKKSFAERVFFCNSGGEANEAAFKLARRFGNTQNPEKNEIISFFNGFHGRTLFTVSVGGQEKYTKGFEPLPGNITHLPYNDLETLEAHISDKTCAVVVEPVQGEGGILPATQEFLEGARRLCDKHNALLIFDEVQTGMGRSGRLFAYMGYGVTPDVLTSAKGLGGGFPIGAMLTTKKYAEVLPFGTHGSTYGGNPLGCAVAEAVIDIVNDPAVLAGVNQRAERLRRGLDEIGKRYGILEPARGIGLLIGVPLVPAWKGRAKEIVNAGLRHGVWTLVAGPDVLRVAPSLIISEADMAEGLKRLDAAVAELAAMPKAANG